MVKIESDAFRPMLWFIRQTTIDQRPFSTFEESKPRHGSYSIVTMTLTTRLLFAAAAVGSAVACSTQVSEPTISRDSSDSATGVPSRSHPDTLDSDLVSPSRKQVKVVVRVWIDANGQQSQAEVRESSGYPAIDKAALDKVASWKFVPGKQSGAIQSMWHIVPLTFHLK